MKTDSRQITDRELEKLKPFSEQHKASLWGEEMNTTPTIVHTVFGNGRSLVTLRPMSTRPDYYVILADSSITSYGDFLNFMREHEELVFQAIEEEYGNVDWQYDEDDNEIETPGECEWNEGEMPLDTSCGYTTGFFNEQPFVKD
ncbi:hypothetical protein LCGC14_2235790 [marine sediment metagenome]|uniref:Uncharacterized protein n=1 Tax=marine sediment metagenome TaxID=412755 RepID=A0A0F9FJI1_9ZZZZ